MRALIVPAAALATLFAVSAAQAAQTSGEVESINMKSRTISLWDGKTYSVAKTVNLADVAPGLVVDITYGMKGRHLIAEDVSVVPQTLM
jgi:Protein of unknown function (DUF1344)